MSPKEVIIEGAKWFAAFVIVLLIPYFCIKHTEGVKLAIVMMLLLVILVFFTWLIKCMIDEAIEIIKSRRN